MSAVEKSRFTGYVIYLEVYKCVRIESSEAWSSASHFRSWLNDGRVHRIKSNFPISINLNIDRCWSKNIFIECAHGVKLYHGSNLNLNTFENSFCYSAWLTSIMFKWIWWLRIYTFTCLEQCVFKKIFFSTWEKQWSQLFDYQIDRSLGKYECGLSK